MSVITAAQLDLVRKCPFFRGTRKKKQKKTSLTGHPPVLQQPTLPEALPLGSRKTQRAVEAHATLAAQEEGWETKKASTLAKSGKEKTGFELSLNLASKPGDRFSLTASVAVYPSAYVVRSHGV